MKIIIAVIFLFLFSVNVIYAQEDSENLPVLKDSNFIVEKFITGLSWPTTFDFIGDDIIVLEKEGNVRLIKNDQLVIDPILNIEVKTGLEDGLLGILVKDEQVYLHYTTEESGKSTNWFYKYTWNGKILQNKELIKKISGDTFHNSGVMTVLDNKVVMVIGDLFNREGITQNFFDGEFDHTSVIMPIDPEGEPIAIGIRRGDHVKVNASSDLNYYNIAIEIICSKIHNPFFFIFSDDIDWCKKNLNINHEHSFVNGSESLPFEDMELMSKCQHNIISNSTYSWWGAYLNNNKDKIVISPKNSRLLTCSNFIQI